MTEYSSSIQYLQVGTQSGTTDVPGSFTFIDPQGEPIYPDCPAPKDPVFAQANDGEITKPVLGPRVGGGFSFTSLIRGNGTGAGNGVSATGGELDALFDALFGFSGQHGVGLTSGSSHTTTVIAASDTSNFYDGTDGTHAPSGMLIYNTNRYEAREVESLVADTSLTPDRAFTNAPANEAVIYGATTWIIDADDVNHPHLYFKLEKADSRRDFLGCALKCKLVFSAGGQVRAEWQVMANHWTDAAEETPTYSAATTKAPIYCKGNQCWISTTATTLIDGSLDFSLAPVPRTAIEGYNGQNGWLYEYTGAIFTGKFYYNDTSVATWQGNNTIDLGLQLGNYSDIATVANCMYIRIPALAIESVKPGKHSGVNIVDVIGRATRPATANGSGSVRVHLFASAS